ncbi:MAG: hypothetical protein GC178_13400 [Flavobacteriales bacterium]|nr:hypothetical protein [Flavobacteriales bacterium]
MNPILRNVLAVVAGIIAGGAANMAIIMLSNSFIPVPEGVNPADMETIKANIHNFQPIHFLMPFLAHAMNAFVGGFVAALIAATHKMRFAVAMGFVGLLGGIMAAYMIPAPTWFIVLDLVVAYLPMAWLAGKLASRLSPV